MTMSDIIDSRMIPFSAADSDENLHLAVGLALSLLQNNGQVVAGSLAEFDDLILPDMSSPVRDLKALKPLPSFYLAYELEQTGLLRTAEKIAGLYFSGAIDQSLGEAEPAIREFWIKRHQRLNQQERDSLLEQAFEARAFYPLFSRLCQAIVALADNGDRRQIQEEVSVDILLQQIREYFFSRPLGLISYAAEDILKSVKVAIAFMTQKPLLTAFGVHSLWELLTITGGGSSHTNRQHAEMASAGMFVLSWLASPEAGQAQFGLGGQSQRLFATAHRWTLAYNTLTTTSSSQILSSAQMVLQDAPGLWATA